MPSLLSCKFIFFYNFFHLLRLQEKWKESGYTDEKLSEAKAKITEAVKKILPKVDDFQFFIGESSNPDGIVALLEYKKDGDDEKPFMYFFKHGLEEEKV